MNLNRIELSLTFSTWRGRRLVDEMGSFVRTGYCPSVCAGLSGVSRSELFQRQMEAPQGPTPHLPAAANLAQKGPHASPHQQSHPHFILQTKTKLQFNSIN
jgi:hypothetical protein